MDVDLAALTERPACPHKYYVDEPVVAALAEQIMVAAMHLKDANGLRLLVTPEFDKAWSAAHVAIAALTGGIVQPVMPSGWVEYVTVGGQDGRS